MAKCCFRVDLPDYSDFGGSPQSLGLSLDELGLRPNAAQPHMYNVQRRTINFSEEKSEPEAEKDEGEEENSATKLDVAAVTGPPQGKQLYRSPQVHDMRSLNNSYMCPKSVTVHKAPTALYHNRPSSGALSPTPVRQSSPPVRQTQDSEGEILVCLLHYSPLLCLFCESCYFCITFLHIQYQKSSCCGRS